MRFLLDTNVLIKLEPNAPDEVEADGLLAAHLNRLLTGGGHAVLVHPAIEHDINRDDNPDRQERNRFLFLEKYTTLPHPPSSVAVEESLGSPTIGSNDWVDLQLIAAVHGNAVHYIVTSDTGLIRKMGRLGMPDRVLTIAQTVQMLRDLFERDVPAPPHVVHQPMYSLRLDDPIWESFREDYPDFDEWFERSAPDGRPAWFVGDAESYEAVCIAKEETDRPHGLEGNVLKICSLKVSESARGAKIGELLLKAVLRYADESRRDSIYLEAFSRHQGLIAFLGEFGFSYADGQLSNRGELILAKSLNPSDTAAQDLSPFEYHKAYGPPALHPSARLFVVPIQPRYHRLLFPDVEADLVPLMEAQPRLPGMEVDPLPPSPYGNAIKKAYLCHSPNRQLVAGDGLVFYRSDDLRSLTTLGVVESTLVSNDPQEVAGYVGARTVYSYDEITEMAAEGEVLAVLFRHDRYMDPVPFHDIIESGALSAAPQSVTMVREEGQSWVRQQLGE